MSAKPLLSEGSPPQHTENTSRPNTVSPGTLHGGAAAACEYVAGVEVVLLVVIRFVRVEKPPMHGDGGTRGARQCRETGPKLEVGTVPEGRGPMEFVVMFWSLSH